MIVNGYLIEGVYKAPFFLAEMIGLPSKKRIWIELSKRKRFHSKNIKKIQKMLKKLLTVVFLPDIISELLGKHQEKQLG